MKEIIVSPSLTFCLYKLIKPCLIGILIIFISIIFQWYMLIYASFPFFVVALINYFQARSISYKITNQQIISSVGLLSKKQNLFELYRVKDFVVSRNFVEILLGVMTITLITSDSSIKSLQLKGIPKSNLIQTIRDYVQEARETNHVYTFS